MQRRSADAPARRPRPTKKEVPVHEFKARLAAYLDAAHDGREVTVTKHGRPFARVVPPSGVPGGGSVRKAELDARMVPLPPPPRRKVTPEDIRRAIDAERADDF